MKPQTTGTQELRLHCNSHAYSVDFVNLQLITYTLGHLGFSQLLNIRVYWNVKSCQLVHDLDCLTLRIKAQCSFKTSVTIYQLTWCKTLDDLNLNLQHRTILKTCTLCVVTTNYLPPTNVCKEASEFSILPLQNVQVMKCTCQALSCARIWFR